MNAPLRTLLLLAAIAASSAAVIVSTRSGPRRAVAVADEQPTANQDVHDPSPPRSPPGKAATSAGEVSPALPASAAVAAAAPSEDSLAADMHSLEDSAPERALELARRGQTLWPSGPRAPEFAATEVKCLYRLGRASDGRGAAEAMVNKYPNSTWALEVERQTGAHPYVNH